MEWQDNYAKTGFLPKAQRLANALISAQIANFARGKNSKAKSVDDFLIPPGEDQRKHGEDGIVQAVEEFMAYTTPAPGEDNA